MLHISGTLSLILIMKPSMTPVSYYCFMQCRHSGEQTPPIEELENAKRFVVTALTQQVIKPNFISCSQSSYVSLPCDNKYPLRPHLGHV